MDDCTPGTNCARAASPARGPTSGCCLIAPQDAPRRARIAVSNSAAKQLESITSVTALRTVVVGYTEAEMRWLGKLADAELVDRTSEEAQRIPMKQSKDLHWASKRDHVITTPST